ncbi:unnamed protein product [Urochloa humidicola]
MSGVQVSARTSDSPAVVLEPPQQLLLQEQQQQQQGQAKVIVTQFSPEAVDEIIRKYKAFPKSETEKLDEMRGWFMVLATLTASITYSAALDPPGGVWQDDKDDAKKRHAAGDPVLRDKRPQNYEFFYVFNLMSFMSSLLIIALLEAQWITFPWACFWCLCLALLWWQELSSGSSRMHKNVCP